MPRQHDDDAKSQDEERRENELRSEVAGHPLVRAVLDAFPGAAITSVRERTASAGESEPETDADDESSEEDGG